MKIRFYALVMIVLGVTLLRLLPHPPNFTPAMAVALFAGAHFSSRMVAYLAPLLAMLLADSVLGFHDSMLFVYLGVMFCVFLGVSLGPHAKISRVFGASVMGSVLFFGLTNLSAWYFLPELYPATLAGLGAAYIAAIPFYYNSLLGDLFYTAILFGGFALATQTWPLLRESEVVGADKS